MAKPGSTEESAIDALSRLTGQSPQQEAPTEAEEKQFAADMTAVLNVVAEITGGNPFDMQALVLACVEEMSQQIRETHEEDEDDEEDKEPG